MTLFEEYLNKYCSFNDDIQGTSIVIVAGLLAAMKMLGSELADHTFLIQVCKCSLKNKHDSFSLISHKNKYVSPMLGCTLTQIVHKVFERPESP